MSEQLTAFERALLKQFEDLAIACEGSLKASGDTATALSRLSQSVGDRLAQIEQQQSDLETLVQRVIGVLNAQSAGTSNLVMQVNALLSAQKK